MIPYHNQRPATLPSTSNVFNLQFQQIRPRQPQHVLSVLPTVNRGGIYFFTWNYILGIGSGQVGYHDKQYAIGSSVFSCSAQVNGSPGSNLKRSVHPFNDTGYFYQTFFHFHNRVKF